MMQFSQSIIVHDIVSQLQYRWDKVRYELYQESDIDAGELSIRSAKVIIENAALDVLYEQVSCAQAINRRDVTRTAIETLRGDFYDYLETDFVDSLLIDTTRDELRPCLEVILNTVDPAYSVWDVVMNRHGLSVKYQGDYRIKEWERINRDRIIAEEGKLTFRANFNEIFSLVDEYFNAIPHVADREEVYRAISSYAARIDGGVYEYIRDLFEDFSNIDRDHFPSIMEEFDELIEDTDIKEYQTYLDVATSIRTVISKNLVTYIANGIVLQRTSTINKLLEEYSHHVESGDYIPESYRRMLDHARRANNR